VYPAAVWVKRRFPKYASLQAFVYKEGSAAAGVVILLGAGGEYCEGEASFLGGQV
jgi:hypothetical protein